MKTFKIILIAISVAVSFISGCSIDEPVVNEFPTVQIVYPTASTRILDTTFVQISASDDRGVVRVELYIDGHIPPQGVLPYEPYTYAWQTSLLPDSTSHVLIAKAYDNDSNVTTSQPVTVVTNRFAPTSLTATMSADTLVKLSWIDNSSIETGYQVLQSINDSEFSIIQTLPPNTTSMQLSGIFYTGNRYSYEVRALIGTVRSPLSNVQFVTPLLREPLSFSFADVTDTMLVLSWIRSASAFEKRIEIEQRQGSGFQIIKTLPGGTTTTSLPGNYKVGNLYSYRARAFSTYNTSVYTPVVTTDIPFPRPDFLGITPLTLTSARLQWKGNCSYEKGFIIFRGIYNSGTTTEFARTRASDSTWDDTSLDTSKGYSYAIQAFTDSNKSLVSDGRSILYLPRFGQISLLTAGSSQVNAVAFVPNSYTVVAGGDDNTLTFWDAPSGTLLRTIQAQAGGVKSIAVSSDGTTLAVGGRNNVVSLWNVGSGTLIRTLTGHTGSVNGVAFSADGLSLISGSADTTVRVWRVSDGTLLRTITGHTSPINSVSINSNGSTIASGSSDGIVKLWHAADGSLVNTLSDQSISVQSVAFSPNGSSLAAGGSGNANPLAVWNVSSGAPGISFPWYGTDIYSIAYRSDGSLLVCGYGDKNIRLWDPAGFESEEGRGHTDKVLSVAISTGGVYIASGSKDATTRIWGWKKSWQ